MIGGASAQGSQTVAVLGTLLDTTVDNTPLEPQLYDRGRVLLPPKKLTCFLVVPEAEFVVSNKLGLASLLLAEQLGLPPRFSSDLGCFVGSSLALLEDSADIS